MTFNPPKFGKGFLLATTFSLVAGASWADNVINDDLIVKGSACIGLDCVNGENFGFDTLRLKENNVRIGFTDTSNTASFPGNDWQIKINDSGNGGANKFSVDDITSGRTPFTIEAVAPNNALYVDDGGRVGFGTAQPVVQLHSRSGNTPTLRLEQDGSSGFNSQIWDMAGNETNFFIRDASNGSTLPFRIEPGAASNALYIENDDDIGMGTNAPNSSLHVRRSSGEAYVKVEATAANTDAGFNLTTTTADWEFTSKASTGILKIGLEGGNAPFKIDDEANTNLLKLGEPGVADTVFVDGKILVNSTELNVPDYVFEAGYDLMPLTDVRAFIDTNGHLPNVPSAKTVNTSRGLDMVSMQMTLLEKVEELTLYTLAQEDVIAQLESKVNALEEAAN